LSPRLSLRLTGAALLVSLLAAAPLFYISLRALAAGPDTWLRLWSGQIPGLLLNTLMLLGTTITFTVVIGVSAAWLVERTNLPGRRVWRWLLALPLAIPAYVAALSYIILLRHGGLLEQAAINWAGFERGQLSLPPLYNLAGATVIIGLCVFPYVYLTVAAALRASDRTLEEAARTAGRSPWGVFRDVTLPLIWPAVAAGALLVGLYVLSDFGTVGMLRYRTFTTAIYNQFTGQIDRSGAAILSFVLVGLTLPLLAAENWFNRRQGRYTRSSAWQPGRPAHLGRWRWPALALVVLLAGLSLGLPLAVLGGLTLQGFLFPTQADQIWRVNNDSLWQYGFNSLLIAVLAATLATTLALIPTYLAVRYPLRLSRLLLNLSKTAFALPGLIVGLGLVMIFNQWLPLIYGTIIALVLGFTFRLLPQSLATGESSWHRVSPTLEQAARVMGCHSLAAFRRVTLPLAAPALLAGWALVFIAAMKELPTAILLRPPGFDTLPVRIWSAASESVYTQAAPPAFLLVGLTMLTLALLYARGGFGLDRVVNSEQ
jgi:iron(III) transport system permease protein